MIEGGRWPHKLLIAEKARQPLGIQFAKCLGNAKESHILLPSDPTLGRFALRGGSPNSCQACSTEPPPGPLKGAHGGHRTPLPTTPPQLFLFVCLYIDCVGVLSKISFNQRFSGIQKRLEIHWSKEQRGAFWKDVHVCAIQNSKEIGCDLNVPPPRGRLRKYTHCL